MENLWDDPDRDFRQRYQVPEHFLWGKYELAMIDYEGYVQVALDLLPVSECHILDVGCGDGWVARETIKRGHSVIGVDYSDRAIGFAKLMVPDASFQVGDIRKLHEHSEYIGAFDAALCIEVIEHVPPDYLTLVLDSIYQCLRPDGYLVITVPSIYLPIHKWHYKHFTVDEMSESLQASGFSVQQCVNQHKMSWLNSTRLWRILKNPYYDLRAIRAILKPTLQKYFNITDDPTKAGRYIFLARKA